MRVFVLIMLLVGQLLLDPSAAETAVAQDCYWFPSSDCPARGVSRGVSHYPCAYGQIKADWNTMLYREPRQSSYASAGFSVNADVWCFDYANQAEEYGFRRAAS